MTLTLPSPIAAYFAADQNADPAALLRLFAPDAVVIDERRTHRGHAAIAQWKAAASAQYRYTATPFAIAEGEAGAGAGADAPIIVTAHLTGDFPGSPIDLRYRFRLAGGFIAALEIAP